MPIHVIPSKFDRHDPSTDFVQAIEMPQFARTLFVFNDNEGEFHAHRGHHLDGRLGQCSPGGGNAAIRPFQCRETPRATGIPTGTYDPGPHYMGYSSLDAHVLQVLVEAFERLDALLATGNYDSLMFSWDPHRKFGGKIFNTAQVVRDQIVEQIYAVAARN